MNIIESLKTTLKEKRKTLSERQITSLQHAIEYLKTLKTDFPLAKKVYDEKIKNMQKEKDTYSYDEDEN